MSIFSLSSKQGFTLVEMIVVMAIFTIVTLVILANLPAFRSRTSLDLLAEEVAVTIRQAQVYGVGTRVFAGEFPSHGIYFDLTKDKTSFILFADADDDDVYDDANEEGCPGECREQFRFRGGVGIAEIKGCRNSGCEENDNLQTLNILFNRPEVEAFFNPDGFSYVRITLSYARNPEEDKRYVIVWNTGHIYACNPAQDSCS